MNRNIVYPGAIPLDTDILNAQRSAMIALGFLAQATLGTSVAFDGLSCTQTASPSMAVQVGPGSALQAASIDTTAYGSLAIDADVLMKMGINTQAVTLALTAPGTSGQSINYLIQAAFQESDSNAVVLPYYNSAAPSVPYSGPGNSGNAQNTQRLQSVNLVAKAGTPATTGTQTTPAADSGFTGLYIVTVAYGATTVINANISTLPAAPFIAWKLPAVAPGFSRIMAFQTAGTFSWTAPAGVFRVKARVRGGGGAGGYNSIFASGGGGSGGYCEGVMNVTPGFTYAVIVGSGGNTPGSAGSGAAGGNSSFASSFVADGGGGGQGGTGANNAGGQGGTSSGGQYNDTGEYGLDGSQNNGSGIGLGGKGGGPGGGRGTTGFNTGINAQGSGGGGGGGGCASGGGASGGSGAAGCIILEY